MDQINKKFNTEYDYRMPTDLLGVNAAVALSPLY